MGKLKEWSIKSQHKKHVMERIFSREVRSRRRERREEGKKKKRKRVMKRERESMR
jgi:hypothetical protein